MMSPTSPIVANLFLEELESKAISTSPILHRLCLRYVDDILVIQQVEHSKQFLHHINFIDPNIQFTRDISSSDGSIPFLDTLVSLRIWKHITNLCVEDTNPHRPEPWPLQDAVSLTPWHIVPELFVPTHSYFTKRNTSEVLYSGVGIPLWP